MNDAQREFFLTGAKTYLDVDDAMSEFRRQVQQQCAEIVSARLRDINRGSQMHWAVTDLKDYLWSDGYHIGKRLMVTGFGGLYFCLELSRETEGVSYAAVVYLWRERAASAPDLWQFMDLNRTETHYTEENNLIFCHALATEQLVDFQASLNRVIDEFIVFIEAAGGLKKYLPQP